MPPDLRSVAIPVHTGTRPRHRNGRRPRTRTDRRSARGHHATLPARGLRARRDSAARPGLPRAEERERERERDESALLTHLPTGPIGLAAILDTYVPNELTRKQLPHRSDPGPSPKKPSTSAARSTTQGRPKPDPYVQRPYGRHYKKHCTARHHICQYRTASLPSTRRGRHQKRFRYAGGCGERRQQQTDERPGFRLTRT